MPAPSSRRSPAEWSLLFRRRHILRAIRHRALSPAAKQVLVALSLADDDPFMLPARPPVAALARQLALAPRTVRQAVAELVEQGCLTFRATGEAWRPEEGRAKAGEIDDPARPDLIRERLFLGRALALPSRAEHLDMLARLRDRAVAAKRIATAVSAERAIGRELGLGGKQRARGTEAPPAEALSEDQGTEAPLDPPHPELEAVAAVNADRALAPAARHALIEILLDPVRDPLDAPEDDRLYWSERLSLRLGITVRGARKALAELEDCRLIAQARGKGMGEVCAYPDRIAERARRGTDAPPLARCDGLDPLHAHVIRLERLRDRAIEQGLVPTALAAERAVGRALDAIEAAAEAAEVAEELERAEAAATAPVAEEEASEPPPRLTPADILPVLRDILDGDPGAGGMMLEILDEIRSEAPQPSCAA